MPKKRIPNFNYNMVTIKGHQYYKAYVQNADEKTVIAHFPAIRNNGTDLYIHDMGRVKKPSHRYFLQFS